MVEARHVLKSGLEVEGVSGTNLLPRGYNRMEAMRQKAVKVNTLDHKDITEEAEKRHCLEYNDSNEEEESEDKASKQGGERRLRIAVTLQIHIWTTNDGQPANKHPSSPLSHGAPTGMISSP